MSGGFNHLVEFADMLMGNVLQGVNFKLYTWQVLLRIVNEKPVQLKILKLNKCVTCSETSERPVINNYI